MPISTSHPLGAVGLDAPRLLLHHGLYRMFRQRGRDNAQEGYHTRCSTTKHTRGFTQRIHTTMMCNRDFTSTGFHASAGFRSRYSDRLSFEVQPVNSEGSSTDRYLFGAPIRLGATTAYTQSRMAPADVEPVKKYYADKYNATYEASASRAYRGIDRLPVAPAPVVVGPELSLQRSDICAPNCVRLCRSYRPPRGQYMGLIVRPYRSAVPDINQQSTGVNGQIHKTFEEPSNRTLPFRLDCSREEKHDGYKKMTVNVTTSAID